MPWLKTYWVAVQRSSPIVKEDVEDIFNRAQYVKFVPPRLAQSDFGSFELEGVGPVHCAYAVAGAWNVAAKCTIKSEDGKEVGWIGWVYDYTPHGSDVGTDSPARFSFCFSPELYRKGKLIVGDLENADTVEQEFASASGKFVCVEGWIDDSEYYVARKEELASQISSEIDKSLANIGLYGGRR